MVDLKISVHISSYKFKVFALSKYLNGLKPLNNWLKYSIFHYITKHILDILLKYQNYKFLLIINLICSQTIMNYENPQKELKATWSLSCVFKTTPEVLIVE